MAPVMARMPEKIRVNTIVAARAATTICEKLHSRARAFFGSTAMPGVVAISCTSDVGSRTAVAVWTGATGMNAGPGLVAAMLAFSFWAAANTRTWAGCVSVREELGFVAARGAWTRGAGSSTMRAAAVLAAGFPFASIEIVVRASLNSVAVWKRAPDSFESALRITRSSSSETSGLMEAGFLGGVFT